MKKRRKMALIILVVIVICCAIFIIHSKWASWNSERIIDAIKVTKPAETIDVLKETKSAETIDAVKETKSEKTIKIPIAEDKIKETTTDIPIDFDAAWEVNQDIIAWIKIPNTTVDYPILQSPDEDNYYMNHDIQKVKNRIPGSIYINLNNSADLTDNNTIIYGHNIHMSSDDGKGSMFGDLEKYYDKEFFEENQEIIIYTPQYIYIYEIFAAVTYNNKLIPALYDLDRKNGYQDFLDSLYNTNGEKDNYSARAVTVGDRIITLSTCTIDHDHNYRYLVTAVLVEEK
ncbi:MAG: sortase [Syntrophomonadaceae bacterium]|nr:sortase [Syntrophomonadaceae bacterium]